MQMFVQLNFKSVVCPTLIFFFGNTLRISQKVQKRLTGLSVLKYQTRQMTENCTNLLWWEKLEVSLHENGVCSKRFPKQYVETTMSDEDGYLLYTRRKNSRTVLKKKIPLHNGFVLPYNRTLLQKYKAHINVELCNQNKSIKYLFKYVNKGHDRVTAAFYQSRNNDQGVQIRDEIKMYYDCRYLSACEATWRIFDLIYTTEIHLLLDWRFIYQILTIWCSTTINCSKVY